MTDNIKIDVKPGYLNHDEIETYVNRVYYAAVFGGAAPGGKIKKHTFPCRRDRQKMAEVRYEVNGITWEWQDRINADCSYHHYSEAAWKFIVQNKVRDDAHGIIKVLLGKKLDTNPELDDRLKLICILGFEKFLMSIEYYPNQVFITPRDIYESLWKCRDFELKHLWQRSIFLSAFLVMCFTGYGSILLKLIKYTAKCEIQLQHVSPMINMAALGIAFLGIVLSVLWIMMGKGSKAWYEQYEQSIYAIEHDPKYSDQTVVEELNKDKLMHGELRDPLEVNDCLFNTSAGRYSVSKINIGIGQVTLVIWCLIFLCHAVLFVCDKIYCNNTIKSICFSPISQNWWKLLIVIIPIICMIVWLVLGFRSSSIKRSEKKKARKDKREIRRDIRKESRKPKTLIILGREDTDINNCKSNEDSHGIKPPMKKGCKYVAFRDIEVTGHGILAKVRCLSIAVAEGENPEENSKEKEKLKKMIEKLKKMIGNWKKKREERMEKRRKKKMGRMHKRMEKRRKKKMERIQKKMGKVFGEQEGECYGDVVENHRRFFNRLMGTNMVIADGSVFSDEYFEKYRPYLIEIVRMTGDDAFWIISSHEEQQESTDPVEKHVEELKKTAGLKHYDLFNDSDFFEQKEDVNQESRTLAGLVSEIYLRHRGYKSGKVPAAFCMVLENPAPENH